MVRLVKRDGGGARARRSRVLLAAGCALGLSFGVLGARADDSAKAAPLHIPSIQDSPGYQPFVDPDSASVTIGRRLDAPLVSKKFTGGARSLDDLGRRVCRALHHESRDSLMTLCVRDDEFRDIMWREFPQSRPATGLTWEDAWRVLAVRLLSGCHEAVRDYGGHYYEFQRFEIDSTAQYKNFTLYSRITLVAKDDEGNVQRMRWLRSIAARRGAYKIFSTDD
jgi:hypothetical protein